MAHELHGAVHVKETGAAVAHVWVRLVTAAGPAPEAVRTAEDGTFSLTSLEQGNGKIEIIDRDRNTLAMQPVANQGQSAIRIDIAQDVLAGAAVRPQSAGPVLRPGVLDTVARGIEQLDSALQSAARQVLARLTCGFGPVVTIPDLLELARDVIEGRAGAATRFREQLRHFEAWNAVHFGPRAVPSAQALSSLFDKGRTPPPPSMRRADPDRIVEGDVILTLVAAATLASGNEPARLWRGLQAVHGQLQALAQLRPLVRDARAASFGEAGAVRRFELTLAGFGGFAPPGAGPFPDFFPGPCPDDIPIGIPDPGDWHDPIVEPSVNDECVDDVLVIGPALAAAHAASGFTVTQVEPADACPGETVILRGTRLSPAGYVPMVGFAIEGSRARRFVTASAHSDTHIEVRVPDDALCGELDIQLPLGEPLRLCRGLFNHYPNPASEIVFHGGRTIIRGLSRQPSGCLHAGGELALSWLVCNTSALQLTIEINERPSATGSGTPHSSVTSVPLDPGAERHVLSLPNLEGDATLHATLVATSRCGRDERALTVGIQRRARAVAVPLTIARPYVNWHGNVTLPAVRIASPGTLTELVDTVRAAERMNGGMGVTLGVEGSRWSYTDCTAAQAGRPLVVDTARLNATLTHVMADAGLATVESVLPDSVHARVDSVATPVAIRERLVHVEAGIKLWDLNCRLDPATPPLAPEPIRLAIPNLGGSRGQSLAGAINTGTHGATVELPPIPDLVRAIHLVANGGQQWWIERASKPVTDAAAMRSLCDRAILDPCLRLEYNDTLFDACLVAMGQAGIVYAFIIETMSLHNLFEETRRMTWAAVKTEIASTILDDAATLPWYYEVSVNPSSGRPAWVTTRTPTAEAVRRRGGDGGAGGVSDALWVMLFGTAAVLGPEALIGLGTGALAFVMGGLSLYIVRRTADIHDIVLSGQWWRIGEIIEIEEDIRAIELLINSVDDIVAAIAAAARGDGATTDEALARALPDLMSALGQIGFYFLPGQEILDAVQNIFTNEDQRPPGTEVGKSYAILTEQPDCVATTLGHDQIHSPLERLIHSQEYAVPAEQLVPFTDAILDAADAVRNDDGHAIIVILNLRFVRQTSAMMGLQQFPLTGLVEVWTVDRLRGNESFYARVNRLAHAYSAPPHWGHVHEANDLPARFRRHRQWRQQLNMIARTAGKPNTFRHQFAFDRGLLDALPPA